MTKAQKNEFKETLRQWSGKLHLTNWEFCIFFEKQDENDTILRVFPDPVYCKARIRVFPVFSKIDECQREQAIVHELIHCHLEPMCLFVKDIFDGKMKTAHDFYDVVEFVTQRLSTVVRPLKNNIYFGE